MAITSNLLVEQSIELSVYSGSVMSVLLGETISRSHWLVVSIESREAKRIMDHIRGQRSADQVSFGTEGLRIVSLLADYLPGDQNNVCGFQMHINFPAELPLLVRRLT
jgi:hypothetical protein